jgi:hypothetical protein
MRLWSVVLVILFFANPNIGFSASGEGTYMVPTPNALSPQATFNLDEVSWSTTSDGRKKLRYKLPNDLVGAQSIVVEMEGVVASNSEFIPLSGSAGSAQCMRSTTGVTCLIRLPNLVVDATEASQYLDRKYSDDQLLLAKRKSVAVIFQREPIGIVSITFDH